MADSRSKRRGEDLPLPPRPPRRQPQQPRGQTEEEIMQDRSGLDPLARYPMMTSEDPGYIVGGQQMMDPLNFEYMRRRKEKSQREGVRLKKGGPVKNYNEGGMVEIEIKVGGGGKRKGMHKMPDGSMMEDEEHEAEEYRKGGPVKKMAKGGATGSKFIQKAIKKPGALRAQLGAKPGQNIPTKKLAAAAKAPGKLGQRARFAQTLAKMKKGK